MHKLRLLTQLAFLFLFVGLSSCDKDEDKEPTRSELLTGGTWSGFAVYADNQDVTQLFKEELEYDITKNTLKFNSDGTYADTYERVTVSGTWEFTNNEQSILFDKGDIDNEYTAKVSKLDGQDLYLQQDITLDDETITLEVRYKR